jgi:hypothetical protein
VLSGLSRRLSGLSRRLASSEDVKGDRSKPLVHRQLRRVRRLVGAVKFGRQITASNELTRAHAYDRPLDHMILLLLISGPRIHREHASSFIGESADVSIVLRRGELEEVLSQEPDILAASLM